MQQISMKNRGALKRAMGLPERRMVSMGDLMASTKKKLKPGGALKPGAKPVKDDDNDGY